VYYVYSAVFMPRDDGGYIAKVPDVPGCVSGGRDLIESMKMIKDALCGCLCVLEDEGETPLSPTPPNNFNLNPGEFAAIIDADTGKYRAQYDSPAIHKELQAAE